MTTILKISPTATAICCGLSLSLATLVAEPARAAVKLPAEEDGRGHCILQDDSEGGPTTDNDLKRCYYEDDVGNGDTITMCVQCDANWKNCQEEPGSPIVRLKDVVNPAGTLSATPLDSTGTTTAPKGGTLDN